MLPRITGMHISNFRGIRDLQINIPKGECLVVIGENGTGKSSIIDAIEFAFTHEISKFSGRADVTPGDCIPFSGADPKTCSTQFEFDKVQTPLRTQFIPDRSKGSASWTKIPAELKATLESVGKRSFILHRAQLTQFIESKPAQRFASISELIGIEILDKTAESWKKERADRERNKAEAEKTLKTLNGEFSTLVDRRIETEAHIRDGINARLKPFGMGTVSGPEEIEVKKNLLAGISSNIQNQNDAGKCREFVDRVAQISSAWDSFLGKYDLLFTTWKKYLEMAGSISEADFEAVIKEGRRLISEKGLDACPVCEQPIDRVSVLSRLEHRELDLLALSEHRRTLDAQRFVAHQELLKCLNPLQSLAHTANQVGISLPENFKGSWEVLESIQASLNQTPLILEPVDCWREHSLMNAVMLDLSGLQKQAEAQINALTSSDEDRRISETIYFLGKVSEKWDRWRTALQEVQHTRQVYDLVDRIYSKLIEARKKGIGEIVENLEKDFVRLFEKLHPGEGHKAIQIILPDNRDQSADLRAETEGMKAMHPLGNFSEGHLDSLGLCIFLAFIKRFNEDMPLIVLDDVLTSIDAGHRMKVAQLIASEFKDNQLVITTHDELWAKELLTVLRKGQISIKVIRMNSWNKENGATYDEFISSNWDYYKQQIDQGRKQDAIGGAGRSLEQFLSTMRKHLHLAIPATLDDQYTLGPLLPAFWRWVKDHPILREDFPDFDQRLQMLADEFDVYWNFRNWSGAHYNKWGASVSADEAKAFVSMVEELTQSFQCPACSSLVIYDTSRKVLHCPVCIPKPSPRVRWEYRPDWKEKAERLLVIMADQSKIRKNLLHLTESAFERALRDARRRLQLSLPARIDDQYSLADLFPPFFEHLRAYPCSPDLEWDQRLSDIGERLSGYFTSDFQWQLAEALLDRTVELYEVVGSLTEMIACPSCHELLAFSAPSQAYSCLSCDSDEDQVLPAAWMVQERRS